MLRREDYIFILISTIVLLFSSLLSPLYGMPYCCDQHIYQAIGRGIMEGLVPYRDLYDQKGPLIFFLFGICQWGTHSFMGIFLVEILCLTVSMVCAYRLALFWMGKRKSFLLTLCLPFLLCRFSYFCNGGNPSEFLVPLQFMALYMIVGMYRNSEAFSPIKVGSILGIGVASALMMKFNLTCFWVLPVCLGAGFSYHRRNLLLYSGAFVLGLLLIILPICLYFLYHHALRDMIDGYFLFSVVYGLKTDSLTSILSNYAVLFKSVLVEDINFFLMVIGIILLLFTKLSRLIKLSYLLSLPFCILSLFGSGRLQFGHYLITLIPYSFIGLLILFNYYFFPLETRRKDILFSLLSVLCVLYTLFCSVNIHHLLSSKRSMFKTQAELVRLIQPGKTFALPQADAGCFGMYWLLDKIPDIRLFMICASTPEIVEQLRMEQYSEIQKKKIDYLAISPEALNAQNSSTQALKKLLDLEYYKVGTVSMGILKEKSKSYDVFCRIKGFEN